MLRSEAGQEVEVKAHPGAVQTGQEQGGLAMLFAALGVEHHGRDEVVDQALLHLMSYLEPMNLETGKILIRQGERQQNLYFFWIPGRSRSNIARMIPGCCSWRRAVPGQF